MYAIVQANQVVEFPIINIRHRFPNVSFPADILDRHLPTGVVRVSIGAHPQYNPATHKVVQRQLPELSNSKWQTVFDVVPLSNAEIAERNIQAREAAKQTRQEAVEALTVTTQAGNTFDGNEDAQNRMSRALAAMDDTDELPWVLHNNTVVLVGKTEMREALRLAGAAMATIWVAPYQPKE